MLMFLQFFIEKNKSKKNLLTLSLDETTSLSLDGDSVSDEDEIEGLAMGSSVKVQVKRILFKSLKKLLLGDIWEEFFML